VPDLKAGIESLGGYYDCRTDLTWEGGAGKPSPRPASIVMHNHIPSEYALLGVYVPPAFLAVAGGLLCAIGIAKALNRTGLSRFFWHPPLAFAVLWVLMTSLIGLLIIAP